MFVFQEPPRTGFEFRWRLFGIRFRLFPSFFVVYGIIAALLIGNNPLLLAIGVAFDLACITTAFLFIGFIEGLVYRSYGLRSAVVLREFSAGIYPEGLPPFAIQRIVVALAYPAACFLLFAILYYSNQEFGWRRTSALAEVAYIYLTLIALFWGIVGLLPIFPYSGGRVMLEVFTFISRRSGLIYTLVLSIVTAVAYIGYSVAVLYGSMRPIRAYDVALPPSLIVSIFFAITAMNNYQMLQMALAQRRQSSSYDDYHDDRAPWER